MYSKASFVIAFLCVFLFKHACAADYSRNFAYLNTYEGIGGVIAKVVGPGPGTSERYYQSYIYDGGEFDLVAFNPNNGSHQVFTSPIAKEKGAWALTVGPDGNIYVGTLPTAHIYRLNPQTGKFIDLGRPSTTEQYIWELVVGTDKKIYGCTYPSAKLVRYDPATGKMEDLGRMDPTEHYARRVAASNDGFIYVGIGFAKTRLVAYEIATGTFKNILPAAYETGLLGILEKRSDGKVYGQASGRLFRLEGWTATPVNTAPAAIPKNKFSDGRVIEVTDNQIAVTSTTDTKATYPLGYSGKPIDVFRLGMGPNHTLYGSGYIPAHLYSINPRSGDLNQIGIFGSGEFYNFLEWDHKLLGAMYYGLQQAPLMIYDPLKPLVPGTTANVSNPLLVNYTGAFPDWRPHSMIHGPQNKVYFGSVSGYGKLGGPLVVWDPATGTVESYHHLITDQSVFSLAVSQDDLIVGGTTINGGGGSHPTQTQAKLFLWDPVTKKKLFETIPVPNARTITNLATSQHGQIYGVADGKVFVFDIPTRTTKLLPISIGWAIFNSMMVAPDGLMWIMGKYNIYAIDPVSDTLAANIPPPEAATAGFAHDDANLYYAAGPKIYRFQRPAIDFTPCTACRKRTGSITGTNAMAYHAPGLVPRSRDGKLVSGWLRGPAGTDFNLYLQKWVNKKWITVAKSEKVKSAEAISYVGSYGYYRWMAQSRKGGGTYTLWSKMQ